MKNTHTKTKKKKKKKKTRKPERGIYLKREDEEEEEEEAAKANRDTALHLPCCWVDTVLEVEVEVEDPRDRAISQLSLFLCVSDFEVVFSFVP